MVGVTEEQAMKNVGLFSALALLMPLFCEAGVVTLDQLQQRERVSVEVGLAETQWALSKADADAARARGGASWVLGLGLGSSTEPITDDQLRSYVRGSVRAGVRYPLLGSAARQRDDMTQAERRAKAGEVVAGAAKRQSLRQLTKLYVSYWAASEKILLTARFLRFEPEFSRLAKERTQVGFLLQADRVEFMTQFDVARRDMARLQLEKRANLRELSVTGQETEPEFDAVLPEPNSACTAAPQWVEHSRRDDASLAILAAELETVRGAQASGWTHWVDADVRLDTSVSQDYPSLQPGTGLGVSLNLNVPWDVAAVARAERVRAHESQRFIEMQIRQRNETAEREAQLSLQRLGVAEVGLTFATQRMRAAIEAVRLAALRAQHLEGDVLERLQIRRYDYYRAAMDYIDARAERAGAQREVASYGAAACRDETPLPAPNVPTGESKTPAVGAYVWHGLDLRQLDKKKDSFMSKLAQAGMERVLMSLDAGQIASLREAAARDAFRNFLWSAQKARVRVDLLLGDPGWILPAHRDKLLEIVRELSDLPFAGFQLDLEPEQLPNWQASSATLVAELARTLQSVAEISPWPLALSAHPRWFELKSELGCVACLLPAMGVGEVSLMVYRTDLAKVVAIVAPILKAFPALQFSVAQSAERELGDESSFATRGKRALGAQVEALKTQLAAPNFAGVLIQDWQGYQGLAP